MRRTGDEGEDAGKNEVMGAQMCTGSVVGEERIGLVIAGEKESAESARTDPCGLVTGKLALSSALSALSSSARSRPGGSAAVI